jgi:hypothetical protein
MTSRDFCYWLQGFFEISTTTHPELDVDQVECIRKHLALVFKHEIDPSAGPPEHQVALNEIHNPKPKPKPKPSQSGELAGQAHCGPTPGLVFRC